jgi:hypothetical protein
VVSRLAALPLMFVLCAATVEAAPAPTKTAVDAPKLSDDARLIAVGLFLDTPRSPASIERSVDVLQGLRCRYRLTGGVRDDEEAARRALAEVEALTFTPEERTRMAERQGVSLVPALCGAACEQFEQMVLLRLRMEALQKLASKEACGAPVSTR